MVRNAVDRIVWVGKGAVFLAGFSAIFAVVFRTPLTTAPTLTVTVTT